MKNYLHLLKETLTKERANNFATVCNIANLLDLELTMHSLKLLKSDQEGANFAIDDRNMIYLYPLIDGMPTCPFEFYKDGKLVINNQDTYSGITNLDDILLQLVRIFNNSLDYDIVIDPYYFMLRLDDEVKENYSGHATLVITEKAIRNQKLNSNNFNDATKYFINHFLDHFIYWNFGVSVNRNETLKNELQALNEKVISMGIRECAEPAFEFFGTKGEVHHEIQDYSFPNANI